MKANELMIGDYVGYLPTWENEDGTIQRDGNPNNPIICKVEMLGSSVAQLDNGEDNFDADDIELYPIPLTPEILKKNGFGYIENDGMELTHFYLGNRHSCRLGLHIGTNNKGDYWVNTNYNDIYGLKYVHELQHAFRLFKLEKDIVL